MIRAFVSYTVYGQPLPEGHCDQHPWVEEAWPCSTLAELCRPCNNGGTCGTDTCLCGEPIRRFASTWWHCHGAREHTAWPVAP